MSKRAYFGTDGIRGQANRHPMTAEVALRVGLAAGKMFRSRDDRRHLVVIGKDTRLSGYMIEPALVAGFTSVGMDVRLFGPLPTPAVAMMTRSMRADLGVMISASHNSFADNGIKLFGPDGYKLSDEQELGIEAFMDESLQEGLASPRGLGRVLRIDDAQARYVEIVKATFPRTMSLAGLRIVIDCAHGAAYRVAPTALYELGAEVIELGVTPNGMNINEESGSTHPEEMSRAVKDYRADIGIALDGDADRLVICDEKGVVVDGDQIMAIIAGAWAKDGRLKGGGIVATVMSNLGLERFLKHRGLILERTAVGDRHVMQRMREGGYNLGGEQSPPDSQRLIHHRRRPDRCLAGAVCADHLRQAAEHSVAPVRAGPAAAGKRASRRWQAARQRQGEGRYRHGGSQAWNKRSPCGARQRHGAIDSHHG